MDSETNSIAALPLTFAGVARLAQASFGRVWAFQGIVALLASVTIATAFELTWVPVITRTIAALPPRGAIKDGQLDWPPSTPVLTASSTFLWITIDPTDSLEPGEGADLQLELGKKELRLRSLLGYASVPFPSGYVISLNRPDLEPWWGAWHPTVTAALGGATFIGLFILWTALALAYVWPIRLVAFYADRPISSTGAWRLGAAALLPGALFLSAAILAYMVHRLNLVQLLAAVALHIMIGWVYVLFAPFCLPRQKPAQRSAPGNPFGSEKRKNGNPFSNRSK